MPSTFTLRHRAEFVDTDMAGIVHFSRYFRYMEITEHAFFRSLGFSVADRERGLGWPRVDVGCEYRSPLRFEDEFEVELRVVKKSTRSLGFVFRFLRDGIEVATGRMTTVCVAFDPVTGALKATSIPDALDAQIEVA